MIRLGLIAAVLLLASVVLAAAGQSARASAGDHEARDVKHFCAATDRQYIQVARENLAAVGLYGDDYIHGEAAASEVIDASRDAVKALANTEPADPSLASSQRYLKAMFTEYARAVKMRSEDRDASSHMYRAYTLGAHAKQVVLIAEVPLGKLGCDVHDLL